MELLILSGLATLGILAYKRYKGDAATPSQATVDGNIILPNDTRDAQSATAALAIALTTAGSIVIASTGGTAAPFVAPAAGAVQLTFSQLSTKQKAAIWRGKA